ncbi:MAG: GNAT family N-acetyltransferase, partial [Candidatus Kariarchaeaceae archaeon]
MINPLGSIDIRIGTVDDGPAMLKFAVTLSEDGDVSMEKWLKIIQEANVHPLVAVFDDEIVGKVQARIVGDIGHIESARVTPKFQKMGLARALIDSAIDWLITQDVNSIRSIVDSDNLPARLILERNNFIAQFLAINPSARVLEEDASPKYTSDFTIILDNSFFDEFEPHVNNHFVGNIMVDGQFVPFTQQLFD